MATQARWYAVITKSDDSTLTADMGMMPKFNFVKSTTNKLGTGTFRLLNPNGLYSDDFIEGKEFKFYYGFESLPYTYGGYIHKIETEGETLRFTVAPYMTLLKNAIARVDGFDDKTGSYIVNDNTVGLIQKYFEDDGDQTTIYSSNYVDAWQLTHLYTDDGGAFSANKYDTAAFPYFADDAAVNDAVYFGSGDNTWHAIKVNVGTAFAATSETFAWEYYNGSSWTAVSSLSDGTSEFGNTGSSDVTWTLPSNWATVSVNSQTKYWVRVRITAVNTPTEGGANATDKVVLQDWLTLDFDNKTLLECMQEVAQSSRRSGLSVPYDFWVDYATATSQIELFFYPKNMTSSGVTLYQDLDFARNFIREKGSLDTAYNWIKVFGHEKGLLIPTTGDMCENNSGDWDNPTGGVVADNNTDNKIGTWCIEGDGNGDATWGLEYDPASDPTITNDGREAYIGFWLKSAAAVTALNVSVDLNYSTGSVGGYGNWEIIPTANWAWYERSLSNIYGATEFEKTYGEWTNLLSNNVDFLFVGDGTAYLDGYTFMQQIVTNPDASPSYAKDATSITAYGKREYHHYDRQIRTVTVANDKSLKLLAELKDPNETYYLPMLNARTDITLGDTFIINSPLHTIATKTLRCKEIRYSNSTQTLVGEKSSIYVDKESSHEAFIRDIRRSTRETARR